MVERDLREVQLEEQRLVRLYVPGKITEEMLDLQRKFIAERKEHLHAKVEEYGPVWSRRSHGRR